MNTKIVSSLLISIATLTSAATFAAQDVSKSTNVKQAFIDNCKEAVTKQAAGKLSTAEVAKYCTCTIEAEGRVTEAQKWEVVSAQNQKKDPNTLPFVQQNRKTLEACIGTGLVSKIKTLNQQAASKPAPAK